ncbi:Putative S-adenosyl-L-methionine-dependent methyltransferase [Candidatus Anstonella stagnisolia]|nr:Putative S-adenosyl-L-methionine-dependent methyltransferase [Candidatus Anstonella stagnisolia]
MKGAQRMGEANSSYYRKKGKRIYSDFKTYAHSGKLLAQANAKEFCEKFGGKTSGEANFGNAGGSGGVSKDSVLVAEFGVGNGKFVLDFLEEVKKKDATLYARTHYVLFDFSERMLSDSQKTLAAHLEKCEFVEFDASNEKLPAEFVGKINYARMNELLDDLPCEFYALENGEVVEAEFDADGRLTGFAGVGGLAQDFEGVEDGAFENWDEEKPKSALSGIGEADAGQLQRALLAEEFLQRVGEGYILPFNFVACEFACELGKALAKDGMCDIFDYGFASAEDIVSQPSHMWNENIVREFDGQLTTDLNVPLLCAFAKSAGLKVQAEGQKEYVESVLGKKVSIEDTKYSRSARGIGESDMFYHVRIVR